MAKIIILGSSNAVAMEGHDNTHMVIVGNSQAVMVDCVSSPLIRLKRAGVDFRKVTDLILTHFHPDHVSGAPLFLMDMWLLGRKAPLTIHGLDYTLDRLDTLMGLYGWKAWPNFFPVTLNRVPAHELAPIGEFDGYRVLSSPVHHLIPTIGLRIESDGAGKIVAYSCDTEPCDEVVRLADGAEILIHEAAGEGKGHSSARQAGVIAARAEVRKLLLIHYPTWDSPVNELVIEAQSGFQGEVALAEDFMEIAMN